MASIKGACWTEMKLILSSLLRLGLEYIWLLWLANISTSTSFLFAFVNSKELQVADFSIIVHFKNSCWGIIYLSTPTIRSHCQELRKSVGSKWQLVIAISWWRVNGLVLCKWHSQGYDCSCYVCFVWQELT
jgi:hypothetical protein